MRIELRRKGKTVSMKCSGKFPFVRYTENGYYGAGECVVPKIYKNGDIIWFGNSIFNTYSAIFNTTEEAKESFERTKAAALDYKKHIMGEK